MENQVKQLKLNVTNIRSTLISANKELRNTRIQKRDLIRKIESKQKINSEEKRLESRGSALGSSLRNIAAAAATPVKGILDRMLEFFGLVAMNYLIQELPRILKRIEDFFNSDFVKNVGSILTAIGGGILKLGQLLGILPQEKMDKIDKDFKNLEKDIDSTQGALDQANKDISALTNLFGSIPPAPELEPIEDPLDPTQTIVPIITPPAAAAEAAASSPQSFASGGTVKAEDSNGKTRYTPKQSGRLTYARRGMEDGFRGFVTAVDIIRESTQLQEQNMLGLSALAGRILEWGSLLGTGRGGLYTAGYGSGSGLGDIVSVGDERELLLRLMNAEAAGEGRLGMALVARSVLNRAGLVQTGKVDAKTYLSRSGSITDIITARDQYTPFAEGKLERNLTGAERTRAAQALALAEDTNALREALRAEGMSDANINKLLSSTGFRNYDAGAGDDASQKVNELKFGRHTFNTAGNSLNRVVRGRLQETQLGDFEGNIVSVGKAILQQGFTIGENKYFIKNNWSKEGPNTGGFDPSGGGVVGSHASSDHATNALDITDHRGSASSGILRLKNLFFGLYHKRQQYGIKALIFDPVGYWFAGQSQYTQGRYDGNHGDHLHVGFTVSADTAVRHEQTRAALSSSGVSQARSRNQDVVVIRQTLERDHTVPVPVPVESGSPGRAERRSQRLSPIWSSGVGR